ncbi:hypothetical protein F4818DRAFT_433787 [Hypoxylon cercidicola]|nr:hypothetical protein F4818DRAFT_433787 [Hypoxylon cercidicola]
MFGPCFEVTGANRLIVQARVCESSGIPIPLFCLKGVCIDYELDIVRYARTRRGRLNFRDVLTYCFPRNYHHLYALLDGKSPASGGAVETGISYSDDMLVVFPTESRYFEDDDSGRSLDSAIEGKRPPKHSKKCFTDFEAKFKDERSGRPSLRSLITHLLGWLSMAMFQKWLKAADVFKIISLL